MGEDVGATLVTTSRVKIRRFTTSDTKAFIGFMTDADSTLFLEFEDYQKTAAGADALIKATIDSYCAKQPLMAFAVERRVCRFLWPDAQRSAKRRNHVRRSPNCYRQRASN